MTIKQALTPTQAFNRFLSYTISHNGNEQRYNLFIDFTEMHSFFEFSLLVQLTKASS